MDSVIVTVTRKRGETFEKIVTTGNLRDRKGSGSEEDIVLEVGMQEYHQKNLIKTPRTNGSVGSEDGKGQPSIARRCVEVVGFNITAGRFEKKKIVGSHVDPA